MAYLMFPVVLLLFSAVVLYLSYYFGQWKNQPVICTVSYTIGWLISLLFVGVLPIDISSTFAHQNEINNITEQKSESIPVFVDMRTLHIFWSVVYWASQLLTWIILPIMESYADSGEFTILRKLRSAIIDNAIIYGSYLILFLGVMIYLLVKRTVSLDAASLKVLLITTSNTWGLFLVIFFLGYGLVEVPRALLRAASPISRLRFGYFSLSKRYLEYIEDEEELKMVLAEIDDLDHQVGPEHPLRSRLNVIVSKAAGISETSTSSERAARRANGSRSEGGAGLGSAALTAQRLVRLHKRLKRVYHYCCRAHALWHEALRQAASAEDVCNNCVAGRPRVFENGPTPAVLSTRDSSSSVPSLWRRLVGADSRARNLEWYWRCRLYPLALRALGSLLAVVSLLVVWSECTFFVREPRLSVIAAIIHSHQTITSYNLIAFVSFAFLGYLGFCIYFTAYRLRFFNYYRLVPNHHSDAISLIFYGYMLCRLTPSLCVNFLCLAHLDSHVISASVDTTSAVTNKNSTVATTANETTNTTIPPSATSAYYETAFTKFMGHLDVVPFIANGFNIYFPIIVVLLCLVTFFSLGSRLLTCLGMPQLIGPSFIDKRLPAGESSPVDDAIEDGRMLLYRERTLSRTRRFARNATISDPATHRNPLERQVKSPSGFQTLEDQDELRVDQTFSPDQPIVEFSEEKMNAMFEFNPPSIGSEGGPSASRTQYTHLDGEGRPLLSKVVSSLHRIFQSR
ncbi:LMBR1 domain-containing protein 2 -like protein [Echinococcus granulosus]|nr:LMBR1 domain-containing protein 2 -like protein [Echinococcus granulosus]